VTELNPVVLERIRLHVPEHGRHILRVMSADPPYGYTIGLASTTSQHEICIVGRQTTEETHEPLSAIARTMRAGRVLTVGEPMDDLVEGLRLMAIDVPDPDPERFAYNAWYYEGAPFAMRQMVYADSAGRFPWEPGCDPAVVARQMLLGPAPR
jgi:hypothetical protein